MRSRRDPFPGPLPAPKATDPRSGFTVPHSELVKEYRGGYVARRFADKPHPLDFPPPRVVEQPLRNAHPEPPEVGIAVAMQWENHLPILLESGGNAILTEGEIVTL